MKKNLDHADRTLLIRNGTIISDSDGHIAPTKVDILINNGVIESITPAGRASQSSRTLELYDAEGRLVTPGLVNAHMHSPLTLSKGGFDALDHPRFMWRNQADTARRTPEEVYVSTVLSAIECVSTGTTAIIDNFPEQNFTTDDVQAVVNAYRDVGIRATVALRVFDREYTDILPSDRSKIPQELLSAIETSPVHPNRREVTLQTCSESVERWRGVGNGRIDFMIAPSAPLRCTDEFLKEINTFSKTHHVGVHTHLLESKFQQDLSQELYGTTLVQHLADLGLLDSRLSCAHCIWLTESDVEMMSKSGATVVHNPLSNLKLGSGVAPITHFCRAGGNVAIGTDGASTNDGLNLLETAKFTAVLHRGIGTPRDQWFSIQDVFDMATINGAKAMQKADEIGSIAVGKKADLTFFDLKHWSFVPHNDLLCHLLYCADARSVDAVMVDGSFIMRDKEFVTVDVGSIIGRAEKAMSDIRHRNQDLYRLAERINEFI